MSSAAASSRSTGDTGNSGNAPGATVGAPDYANTLGEVQSWYSGCKTRCELALGHLESAARCLRQAAALSPDGEAGGGSNNSGDCSNNDGRDSNNRHGVGSGDSSATRRGRRVRRTGANSGGTGDADGNERDGNNGSSTARNTSGGERDEERANDLVKHVDQCVEQELHALNRIAAVRRATDAIEAHCESHTGDATAAAAAAGGAQNGVDPSSSSSTAPPAPDGVPESFVQDELMRACGAEDKRVEQRQRALNNTLRRARDIRALLGKSTSAYDALLNSNDNRQQRRRRQDDDDDEIGEVFSAAADATQARVSIRCPLTGTDMRDAVQNQNCVHTYEREAVEQHIRATNRLRAAQSLPEEMAAPCPVAGCEARVSRASLNQDVAVMLRIERLRNAEERRRTRRTHGHVDEDEDEDEEAEVAAEDRIEE